MSYGLFACHFLPLKRIVVSMGVVLLFGCANTTHTTNTPTTTPTAKEAFAQLNQSQNQAKSALTTALNAHLASERVAVTRYYHQTNPKTVSPLDKNADAFWETLLKMEEYKAKEAQNTGAYRTHDAYFAEDDLYLRYYDEKNGTLPQEGYDLSRSAGVENAVQYGDKQVKYFAERYKGCVTTVAHDVDALVLDNPAIDVGNARFNNRLYHFDECLKKTNKNFALVFENPTVYQAIDLDYIKSCAGRYRQNLSDVLAKNRVVARYEGDEYDLYESVYGNFAVCYAGFEMGYRLDPAYYTELAYSQSHLEQLTNNRQCALDNLNEQETLSQNHQSYATDPKTYATSFYRYFECLDKAMLGKDGERQPNLPSSFADAKAQYELYKEWLDFNAGDNEGDEEESTWLDVYFKMKQLDIPVTTSDSWAMLDVWNKYGGLASDVLNLLKQTPEQALAKNLYQHDHTQLTVISHHRPQDKTVSAVVAMEFDTPTATQRLTVPFYADFKNEKFVGDASPLLPVMAFFGTKNTPIFDDTIPLAELKLPQELSIIPATVLYDALQKGYEQAIFELPASKFGEMVPADAPFNQEFRANRVLRLDLGSKEMGRLVGTIAKQLEHDLSAFVDNNPKIFDDNEQDESKRKQKAQTLKTLIKKWATLNQGYRTDDVASAMQLIEVVLPIGIAQSHYYYLDKGRLIAHVARTELSQDVMATQEVQLMVANYQHSAFDQHPLKAKLLTPSTLPVKPFALNDWLSLLSIEGNYQKDAQGARLDYYVSTLTEELTNENEGGVNDEKDTQTDEQANNESNNVDK